jgi:DNA-binding transcriptional MerR regulator
MVAEVTEENIFVIRNLKDAGCDCFMIEKFLQLKDKGKTREQLHLLSCQRTSLLQKVHENQKRIDCLDFLIFNMKKKTS